MLRPLDRIAPRPVRAGALTLQGVSAAAVLALALPVAAAETWSDLHGTQSASGIVSTGARFNPGTSLAPPLALQWSFQPPPGTSSTIADSSPALVNGFTYFGSRDGSAYYCLNTVNGAPAWSSSTANGPTCPGWVRDSPLVANPGNGELTLFGGAYGPAGCLTDAVQAIDAATGLPIWSFPTGPGGVYATGHAISNGVLYVGSSDGNLYALNAGIATVLPTATATVTFTNSGTPTVTATISSTPLDTSTFCPSLSFSPSLTATLTSSSTPTTTSTATTSPTWTPSVSPFLWSYTVGGSIVGGAPATDGSRIYVSNNQGFLYAISSSGSLAWSYGTLSTVTGSARQTVAGSTLYGGLDDQHFFAWNTANGTVLWSLSLSAATSSVPAVAYGLVYFGDASGVVRAVNATNGAVQWSWNSGAPFRSSVAVSNGYAYLCAGNNRVYAMNATAGGTPVWSAQLPTVAGGTQGFGWCAPAIADGKLVATDAQGAGVFAFVPTTVFTPVPTPTVTATPIATSTVTGTPTVSGTCTATATISTTPSASGTVTSTATSTPLASLPFLVMVSSGINPGPTDSPKGLWQPSDFPAEFRFALAEAGKAGLGVFDSAGERVALLFEGLVGVGDTQIVTWDGHNGSGRPLASGIYVVRLYGPHYLKLWRFAFLH